MAVRIANAGHDVSVVARGAHLAAIKTGWMRLIEEDNELTARNLIAPDCISELAPQDVVLLALKAHQITSIVNDLEHLLGPDTVDGHPAELDPMVVFSESWRGLCRQDS